MYSAYSLFMFKESNHYFQFLSLKIRKMKNDFLELCRILSFLIRYRLIANRSLRMRYFLLGLVSLISLDAGALEYEIQLENESVSVARAKIMPYEEIGLHRDAYPQVVVALQGGVITRLEADGSTTDVNFPTGRAIFREIDPPDQLHKSVNNSSSPVELIIIQLKK